MVEKRNLPGRESESEDKGKHAGVAPGPGDGGGKGNGKGESGGPGGGRATIGLEEERPVGGGNAAPTDAIPTSGGGSSPLIPVLIAVAVLAAISIGTVIYTCGPPPNTRLMMFSARDPRYG